MEPMKAAMLEQIKASNKFTPQMELELVFSGMAYDGLLRHMQRAQGTGLPVDPEHAKELGRVVRITMNSIPHVLSELIVRGEKIKELEAKLAAQKPATE